MQSPHPVKYFVAVLAPVGVDDSRVKRSLADEFGAIDYTGARVPFDVTDYYTPEMGPSLERHIIGFGRERSPEELADAKAACIRIEKQYAVDGKRVFNLDIGYLDHGKVVLASTKEAGQKIYLRGGIFADLVARFSNGAYRPFEWTFPDFKTERYAQDLQELRHLHLASLRALRAR